MSWELIAENLDSLPENYNLYECSECGNRVASPEKPEIICYEHRESEVLE